MEGKTMLNKIKTFIAFAILSGTVSANVHAETITAPTGDTLVELQSMNDLSSENNSEPEKAQTTDEQTPKPEAHALKPETEALKNRTSVVKAEEKANEKAEKEKAEEKKAEEKKTASKKQITVKATAYTASCEGCSGITKTGVNIKDNPDAKVIAVDPDVIPLGSKVYVEGFGKATAADIGGGIDGKEIDIFIPSEQDAIEFGVQKLKVTILN
jgi:3D (Asp-Asp-Asp) domain-containing protein